MDNETEMIRTQMEGTRLALSEKLEKLEDQVTQKVQQASTTVAETVESASEMVDNVKETVEETVDAVKHTFDLNWHAQQHPWLLMGGAMVLGYVGSSMLLRSDRSRRREPAPPPPPPPPPVPEKKPEGSSGGILGKLGQEVLDLKKVGVGLAMGLMREVFANALPTPVAPLVSSAMNNLTVKLGGQLLGDSQPDHTSTDQSASQEDHSLCGTSR